MPAISSGAVPCEHIHFWVFVVVSGASLFASLNPGMLSPASRHTPSQTGHLMIELEIQALSERRQGLLVEIGHFVIANGFTLQRQRLIQDPHGILLTMVIRGPARKQRALQAALDAHERIISFQLAPFVEGEQKPHFAASRKLSNYVPAPMPEAEPAINATKAASPEG
jgi:hypothetical protein